MYQMTLISNDIPGWLPPGDLSLDQWRDFGSKIKQAEGVLNWIVGDWILAANPEWGEMYDEAMRLTGWSYEKLQKCKLVAVAFQMLHRSNKLSWTHHYELYARGGNKKFEYLSIAERDSLSVRQLIDLIDADKSPSLEDEETPEDTETEHDTPQTGESIQICPECGQVYEGEACPDCQPANGRNYKRDNKSSAPLYTPQGLDACQTPAYALDPLLTYLPEGLTIWEPACGEGLLEDALIDSHLEVVSGDLQTGQDFFEYEPEYDCQVTNPPFSKKFPWLKRCYELGKPFALLLPVETLGAKAAQQLFDQFGIEVIFMDKRINFKMPNKGWDGGGAQFPVAWFTWGLNIGQQMTFAKVVPDAETN